MKSGSRSPARVRAHIPRARTHVFQWSLAAAAALVAVFLAFDRRWMTDDAYISFRYAEQLISGHGLVFNPGERVEGMTNFLWTLWIAAGMAVGVSPETWAILWGLVSLAVIVLGLGLFHARMCRRFDVTFPTIPLAAFVVACHAYVLWFATGGLETAAFTALMLVSFLMLTTESTTRRFDLGTGVVMAACALTRPEGLMGLGMGAVYLFLFWRTRLKACLLGFGLVWIPAMTARVFYYGDLLPNTFYAKSNAYGRLAQGWFYARLYFAQFWPLLLGLPLAPLMWRRFRARPELALVVAFALAYTAFVIAVAGDFMYARFMIPATPFFAMLLDAGVLSVSKRHRVIQPLVAAGLCAIVVMSERPFPRVFGPRGIADEPAYYTPSMISETDQHAAQILRYAGGLDYSVAFFGGEARLVYKARVPVAIESETGLNDPYLARRKLEGTSGRERVGHEKTAPIEYLIDERKIDFFFHPAAPDLLRIDGVIPAVTIGFGNWGGWMLRWDAHLVAALRARGAEIPDFVGYLQAYADSLSEKSDAEVANEYAQFKRFYFDHTSDPELQNRFEQRLAQTSVR